MPDKNKIKLSCDRLINILKKSRINKKYIGIRISPSEPDYFNNYEPYNYTLDIYDMYLRLNRVRPNVFFNFDCPVNACEIDFDFYENKGANITFNGRSCSNDMPFDIMPDKSAIWCSSLNFIKVNNIFDYDSIDDCIQDFIKQYNDYWTKNKLQCNYKTCGKYRMCPGLCIAKNESIKRWQN